MSGPVEVWIPVIHECHGEESRVLGAYSTEAGATAALDAELGKPDPEHSRAGSLWLTLLDSDMVPWVL